MVVMQTGPFPLTPRKDRAYDALKMLDLPPHTSPSCEESCLQRMTLLNKNPSELPERSRVARWPVDARTRLGSHTHAPVMTTAWAHFVQNLLLGKPLLSLKWDKMLVLDTSILLTWEHQTYLHLFNPRLQLAGHLGSPLPAFSAVTVATSGTTGS